MSPIHLMPPGYRRFPQQLGLRGMKGKHTIRPIDCDRAADHWALFAGEQPKVGGVLCGKRLRIFTTEARIPAFKDSVKITI